MKKLKSENISSNLIYFELIFKMYLILNQFYMNSISKFILNLGFLTTACGTTNRLSSQNSHELESPFCITFNRFKSKTR